MYVIFNYQPYDVRNLNDNVKKVNNTFSLKKNNIIDIFFKSILICKFILFYLFFFEINCCRAINNYFFYNYIYFHSFLLLFFITELLNIVPPR